MIIASIVLGILFIAAGVTCMSAPVDAYLKAAYCLAILLFVYGIFGIARFAKKQTGEVGLAISVLALLIGAVYIFRPGDTPEVGSLLVLDRAILTVIALWYLFKGVFQVRASLRSRLVNRKWFWGLIVGVLSIVLGIYSLTYPEVAAMTSGTLLGFYSIQIGLDLLVFGTTVGFFTGAAGKVKDAVNDAVAKVDDTVSGVVEGINEKVREAIGTKPAAEEPAEADGEAEQGDESQG